MIEIVKFLEIRNIIVLTAVCKSFRETFICKEVNHVYSKFHGLPYNITLKETHEYLSLEPTNKMIAAIQTNELRVVERVISSTSNIFYNNVIETLIKVGNLDIIEAVISDGASYHLILAESVKSGKLDIVEFLIENLTVPTDGIFKMAMLFANNYNHQDIVEYISSKVNMLS